MRLWFLILALAFAYFPLCLFAAASAAANPRLFDTAETASTNLTVFTQWTSMLQRALAEKAKQIAACSGGKPAACRYANWDKFLSGQEGKDELTKVNAVNDFMNRAKYITDPDNHRVADIWNSPGEFLNTMGDCEDYAISKYFSLKKLGFSVDRLRVVAVQDLNLRVGHAILAVYMGDHILILDNQIKQVVDARTIKHYKPVFSINENSWWRHVKE